jgi:hypothetical protein
MIKMINKLKRQQIMRRIEYQDADEQHLHAQTIPKAYGFEAATQSMRAYPSLRDEAATPKTEKKVDLKKQSQFDSTLMGATPFVKGDYENKPAGGAEKNKANQSQFHNPALTEGAGKSEKSLAAATG